MYADDIIIYLSKPEQSIEALMKVIEEIGAISGYVLNVNKSEVMVMGCTISDELKHKYAFHWDVKRIKYLGINITKNLDNLYSKNFDELTCQIKLDLNRWSIIPFSVRERVNIIQMNILPRFLFLFKALLIYIVSNTFKQWDSIIMNFIWNGRKTRIKMKYLKLPKEKGGLHLPNLQAYYQAAQVKNVKIWMLESPHIRWREMEVNCGDIPLTALPFSNYKKSYIETLDNRWVVATLKHKLQKQITRNWLKDDNLINSKWKVLVNEMEWRK
uniref:Reverse transcriptase domain-containing protein n=1 Tax=Myripristis murdjan TaxID=586833 RepID=A0A667ZGQ6_9TELE